MLPVASRWAGTPNVAGNGSEKIIRHKSVLEINNLLNIPLLHAPFSTQLFLNSYG
jgi:hypothetical protein